MQHVSAVDFASLSPAAAKKAALAAFASAVLDPHGADWQAVAYGLNAALTAKRATKAEEPAADGFLPWYAPDRENYPKSGAPQPRIDFVFADGVTVSAAAWQKPGKPINIGLACRVALDMYRATVRNRLMRAFPWIGLAGMPSAFTMGQSSPLTVPAIVSATYRDTGEAWNPDTLNRETEAARVRQVDGLAMLECEDKNEGAAKVRQVFEAATRAGDVTRHKMRLRAMDARDRVSALLYPEHFANFGRYDIEDVFLPIVKADPAGYPFDECNRLDLERSPGMRPAMEAKWGCAWDASPSDAPPAPLVAPSRTNRLRLVALNSTAGVPLAAPVALRRDVSIRLAA